MIEAPMPGRAMPIEPIRLFISSPGDVQAERMRVVRVAERLQGLTDGLTIEVYRWEGGHYFSAHADFQRQIDAVEAFDIVIAIFWSRLGTPPPAGTPAMPDGRPYPSGTAFEVLRALDARQRGAAQPDVLVYRKTASPPVSATDSRLRVDQVAQLDRLDAFFHEWFVNPAEGFKGAFTPFETPDEFETLVEAHLAAWIAHHRRPAEARRWRVEERGSPFVGLNAFGPQHRDVFFGRRGDIERARERLEAADARGCGFLLIEGASGVGKSSLALAGLAPRLIERDPDLRLARMRPGDADGPLASLARALFADGALPELADGDFPDPSALARHLAAGAGVEPVLRALTRAAAAAVARGELGHGSPVRLALVVDQLEEAFGRQVAAAQRTRLAETLSDLAHSRQVLVVATLRADARADALAEPALAALIDAGAGLALSPPGPDALSDIVRGPAAAAGIAFERGPDGRSLDEALIAEAGGPAALPLLQFTLAELYERAMTTKPPDGRTFGDTAGAGPIATLTFADHHAMGGLAGAVSRQAEAAFAAVPEAARAALPRLVRALTDAGGYGEAAAPVLRAATLEEASPDAAGRTLVEALATARIVSRDGARLRFTHETALSAWARAAAEAARAANYLRIRAEVGAAAARWRDAGERRDLLIPSGVRLEEARAVLAAHGDELPGDTRRFIRVSHQRARRGQTLTAAASILFALIAAGALWFQREATHNATIAERAQARAETQLAATEREARRARSAELVTRAQSLLDAGPGRNSTAALLALESLHLGGGEEAHGVIEEVMARLPASVEDVPHAPAYSEMLVSADGRHHLVWTAVSSGGDTPGLGEALVFDPASGAATPVALHDGWVHAAPSADGRWLAVTGFGLRLQVVDLANGRSALDQPLPAQGAAVFAPDGRTLFVLRADGVLERREAPAWAVVSEERLRESSRFDDVLGVQLSPDGSRMLLRFWEEAWLGPPGGPFHRVPDLTGRVYPTAFDPSGERLATVSRRRRVEIRDAGNGAVGAVVRDAEGVTEITFSSDGTRLAIGDRYGRIEVHDARNGALVFADEPDAGALTGLGFAPDGTHLVSVHERGAVRIADATTGAELRAFVHGAGEPTTAPTFVGPLEADGTLLIGSADGRLVRFDTIGGTSNPLYRAGAPVSGIASARPLPGSDRLVVTVARSNRAHAWTDLRWVDAATGQVLWRRDLPGLLQNAVASPDGSRVATSVFSRAPNVTLWDPASGESRPLKGLQAGRDGLWFSADGAQLIARYDALVVADVASGERLHVLGEPAGVGAAAVAAGGTAIVHVGADAAGSRAMRAWDPATGTTLWQRLDAAVPDSPSFGRDGDKYVYFDAEASAATIADSRSGEPITHIPLESRPRTMALSPDGRRLALSYLPSRDPLTGAHRFDRHELWDLATAVRLLAIEQDKPGTSSFAFGPQNTVVADRVGAGVSVFDAESGAPLWDAPFGRSWDASLGRTNVPVLFFSRIVAPRPEHPAILLYSEGQTMLLDPRDGRETAVLPFAASMAAFSSDGRKMVARIVRSAGELGPQIAMIDLTDATVLWLSDPPDAQQAGDVHNLWLSADDRWVLAEFQGDSMQLPFLHVFDAATGEARHGIAAEVRMTAVLPLADPDLIAAKATAGWVGVWRLSTGEALHRVAETRGVDAAAVASGAWRALTRKGGALRVWDLRDGSPIAERIADAAPGAVALDPSGRVAAYRGPSGPAGADESAFESIALWTVDTGTVRRIPVAGEPKSLSFDPTGRRLAAVIGTQTLAVWDVDSGRQIATLPSSRGGEYTTVAEPTFIGDGAFLIATEATLERGAERPWQLRGWHLPERGGAVEVLRLDRPWRHSPAPGARVTWGTDSGRRIVDLADQDFDGIAFASARFCCGGVVGTDRMVVDTDYERIAALDVTTGTIVAAHRNPASDSMSAAAFADDLAHAFVAERDSVDDERAPGTVRWVDTATGATRAEWQPDATIAHILPIGGDAALLLGSPGGTIRRGHYENAYLWRPAAGVRAELHVDGPVGGAVLTPDRRFVVLREGLKQTDERDRFVVVGEPRITVWDTASGARVDSIDLPEPATDITFTSDGRRMVYRTSLTYHVRAFGGAESERSGGAGGSGAVLTARDLLTGTVERGHAGGRFALLADRWIAMPDHLSLRLISLDDGRTVSLPHDRDHPTIVESGEPMLFATVSAGVLRVWHVDAEGVRLQRTVGGVKSANNVVFAGPENALYVATDERLQRVRYRVEEIEPELCRRLGRGLDEAEKRTWFARDTPTDPCSSYAAR